MKNDFIKKIFISVVLIVLLMVCFSACGKDKTQNVFLAQEKSESKINDIEDDNKKSDNHNDDNSFNSENTFNSVVLEEELSEAIYVQVNGAVNNPGVYKIEKEMRIFEVIELAGGVTVDGATEAVNMARPVMDEMVIYVPTKEEVIQGFSEETETVFEDYELNDKKLININTAQIDELMTLSGIGEAKAKQIIEYRKENGGFKDISEIMNISGIKQSAFEKIKDYITV